MKVSNYLNEKNIKYLPVSLYEYEKDGKKKIGINGAHDYHDFETLDATAIHTRQNKNKTYPLRLILFCNSVSLFEAISPELVVILESYVNTLFS